VEIVQAGQPLTVSGPGVVTVGVFDGVHLGHQRLLREARTMADEEGADLRVVLFDRHPATVVRPETAPHLLTDLRQRFDLLAPLGVDGAYVVRFDEERSLQPPEDFVREVLVDGLRASVHVVGEDYHFGHRRRGNLAVLAEIGATLDLKVVGIPLLADGGSPITATAIREDLRAGELDRANRLLGRPHEVRGVVEHGDARGRTIGFPTANVAVAGDILLPNDGVYAGWYVRPGGSVHPAAINVGRRPTFYDENGLLLVEAHLIDFDGDLYGERAAVRFTHRLRDERKFAGIEELQSQLQRDVAAAREALA
jgi:riboflavin kinase / FMN adenylyltransferase